MDFNENTQFPIFTKRNSTYFYYLSKGMFFCFNAYNASVYLESVIILSTEEVITKEEFIEANKDLLQKTGLINLFEGSEKSDFEISEYQKHIKFLETSNATLKKQLSQEIDKRVSHSEWIKQSYDDSLNEKIIDLEQENEELRNLLKRYL